LNTASLPPRGVAIILAVTAVGDGLNATFNEVAAELG
jgi:Flp pilus assembly pilin Flp